MKSLVFHCMHVFVCVCVHKFKTHSLCLFMYIQWD